MLWYLVNTSSSPDQALNVVPWLSKKGSDFGGAWEMQSDQEVQCRREIENSSSSDIHKLPCWNSLNYI